MQKTVFLILKSLTVISALVVSAFFFSFSSVWNLDLSSFGLKKDEPQDARKIFGRGLVELSAAKIFGNNMTERLAAVGTNYLMAKFPGGLKTMASSSISAMDAAKVNLLGRGEIEKIIDQELRRYTKEELNLVPDSIENITAYLNNVFRISGVYLEEFREFDVETLIYEANINDESAKRKSTMEFIDNARLALDELAILSVPESWADYHLGLLNLLSESRYTALAYLLFEDDPVRGRLAFDNYEDLSRRVYWFNQDFSKKFQEFNKTLKN